VVALNADGLPQDEEENVVRGDKGRKEKTVRTHAQSRNLRDRSLFSEMDCMRSQVINTTQYFKRSMSLARGQFHLIALAMVFLFIASSAGILLPNYQGAILDRVIQVRLPFCSFSLRFASLFASGGRANGRHDPHGRPRGYDLRSI
jgi:hypothetical protein